MAIDLNSISIALRKPPRLVIYGVPGIGKTTFAAQSPAPVFLPIEDGCGGLNVPAFPRPTTYEEVLEAIESLLSADHEFCTLVIDSLDKLEPLLWEHVLRTVRHEKGHKVERIEDYGYGKGYTHAMSEWRLLLNLLDKLRDRGMGIIAIAHSAISKFESPDLDPFDRYSMRLHKQADAAICDWADAVLFANYTVHLVGNNKNDKKRGVGTGERVLHTNERPAWRAKNRYGMPDTVPLSWDVVEKLLAPATEGNPAPAATN